MSMIVVFYTDLKCSKKRNTVVIWACVITSFGDNIRAQKQHEAVN